MGIFSRKDPWESRDPKTRLNAVKKSQNQPVESWEKLTLATVDPDEEVRLAVIEALRHNYMAIHMSLIRNAGAGCLDGSVFQNILNSTVGLLSGRIESDDSAVVRAKAATSLGLIWMDPDDYDSLSETDRKFEIEVAQKSLATLLKAGSNDQSQEVKSIAGRAVKIIEDYYQKADVERYVRVILPLLRRNA